MGTIQIPVSNWHTALVEAIKTAQAGDTIVVDSQTKKELAEIAMRRLNVEGLNIVIDEQLNA